MLFILDAGHGGKDPGAVGNGLYEKDITLELAIRTGSYMNRHFDCDVAYTRNKDVFLGLSERATIANRLKADFFCSFHINSFNASSKGFETFRYPGTQGKTANLQNFVHEEVMKVLKEYQIVDRGKKQQNFAVVRETKMPALLTETLFISNPTEAKLLRSETFLEKVAIAHAIGLARAAGAKRKSNQQSMKKFHLITGDFKNKQEAEKNAEILRDKYGWLVHVKES